MKWYSYFCGTPYVISFAKHNTFVKMSSLGNFNATLLRVLGRVDIEGVNYTWPVSLMPWGHNGSSRPRAL